MLKTLGKITWKKIKINEVFAYDFLDMGIFEIAIRTNKNKALTIDYAYSFKFNGSKSSYYRTVEKTLYKLPKSVQKLFKEE